MSTGDFLSGAVLFAAMLAAALAGSWILLRQRFSHLRGAEAATAFGVIATCAVLAIHLLPAVVGLLGRGSVLIASALWVAACMLVPPVRAADPAPPAGQMRREEGVVRLLGVVAAGLTLLFFLTFARDQLAVTSGSLDFATFHLPNVIGWIQSGSIWQVDSYLPSVAPGNYPNNGDVMLLAFVLPWHNDFLSHASMWVFYALTAVATYALAFRLGASRWSAVVAACLIAAIPAVSIPAVPDTLVDSVMLFGFAAGVLLLLRHDESGAWSDLILAGLALGIAFGAKWYGVSAVAVCVAVWAVARLLAGRGWRAVLRQGTLLAAMIGLAGGIWLLRNWILSGNPVFPVRVAPFGLTIFDAPFDVVRDRAGFTILDYVGDWSVWWRLDSPALEGAAANGIVLQWWNALAAPALLILVGALGWVGAIMLGGRTRRGSDWRLAAVAAVAALVTLVYAVTPYTAGGPEGFPFLVGADSRYVVPALVLAAAVAAAFVQASRAAAIAFGGLGIAAIVHGVERAASGELTSASLSAWDWAATVAGLAILAGIAWALDPWARRVYRSRQRVPVLAAVGAIAIVVLLAIGNAIQQRFDDDRYLGSDPALDAIIAASTEPQRVGLAGVWTDAGVSPILPSFGPRFENEVEYIGPIIDEMRQRYATRSEFSAALDRGDYDFVIIGRGRSELESPPELDWASSLGWKPVAGSDRLVLYEPA